MTTGIRIRTSYHEGITTVRSIIRHPMETGFSFNNETGEYIPAHYIKEVICKHGDKIILHCDWSRAISKNPYLSFKFSGAEPGDSLSISWVDSKDQTDSTTVIIE